jgi:hypothetical protein
MTSSRRLHVSLIATLANPAQLRLDRHRLVAATQRLSAAVAANLDSEKYAAEVTELLDELASYERYWLFPGTATLAKMREYLAGDDVGWLSHMATRAVHRLSEYGDAASLFDIDVPLAGQEAATTPGRRQFVTVLLADDTPEDVPRALAGALGRLEVGTEDFVLGLLVVGSVEDALAAVALNDEIQACIIRRDLPLHAPTRLPLLDKLIDVGAETPAGDRTEHGIECGQLISELRPHLDLYLLTDESVATRDPRKHDVLDLLPAQRGGRAAQHGAGGGPAALRDPVLRRPAQLRGRSDRAIPRPSGGTRGEHLQLPVAAGHGRVLRPQHLPRRDLVDLRRAGLAARPARHDPASDGQGREDLGRPGDVLRHQRHLHGEQDRAAGADPTR